MMRGRQEAEWGRLTSLMSWIGKVQGGKWIPPERLNPFHKDPPKTPEQQKAESNRAFRLLGTALRDVARRRR